MFTLLSKLYPQDFIDFFTRNYFWFLGDVFHKWLDSFDIEIFHSIINNLDSDLKFIFENPSKSLNFLDISIPIAENNLVFDVLQLFNNISCHPSHTKNNIWL